MVNFLSTEMISPEISADTVRVLDQKLTKTEAIITPETPLLIKRGVIISIFLVLRILSDAINPSSSDSFRGGEFVSTSIYIFSSSASS